MESENTNILFVMPTIVPYRDFKDKNVIIRFGFESPTYTSHHEKVDHMRGTPTTETCSHNVFCTRYPFRKAALLPSLEAQICGCSLTKLGVQYESEYATVHHPIVSFGFVVIRFRAKAPTDTLHHEKVDHL